MGHNGTVLKKFLRKIFGIWIKQIKGYVKFVTGTL